MSCFHRSVYQSAVRLVQIQMLNYQIEFVLLLLKGDLLPQVQVKPIRCKFFVQPKKKKQPCNCRL